MTANDSPLLRRDDDGLVLVDPHSGRMLRGDLSLMLPRVRPDRLHRELLVRAARVRGVDSPTAVDATAGLGEDSFLLAAAGFSVTLFEREPSIAALLADALDRARASDDATLSGAASRMTLVEGDSVAGLRGLPFHPDVVLLDPMFPAKRADALAKKKLQVIQALEQPCSAEDEKALLAAAIDAAPRKVIVKRPLKGPWLAGHKPSSSLSGKTVRYDCIAIART